MSTENRPQSPFGSPTGPQDPSTLVKPALPQSIIDRHIAEKGKSQEAAPGDRDQKVERPDDKSTEEKRVEQEADRKKKLDAASGRNSVKAALFDFLKKPDEKEEKEEEEKDEEEKATLTPEQIAKLSAESAAAAVGKVVDRLGEVVAPKKSDAELRAEAEKAEQEKAKKDPNWLPEEYRQDADLYDALAKINPGAYGDIRQKIRKAHESEEAYVSAWEKRNPGKEFDGSDEEHTEFYSKNEVSIPADDLKAAKEASVDIRADRVAREAVKQEREKRSAAEMVDAAKREAEQRSGEETLRVLAAVNPEYDMVGKSGGEADAVLRKIQGDRVFVEAVNAMAPSIASHFAEVVLIYNGVSKLDASNPVHASIVRAAGEAHKKVSSLPADKRERGGRMYVPAIQYNSMPDHERSKFWTIGPEEIMAEMRGGFASAIKARVKQIRKWAFEVAGLAPEEDPDEPGAGKGATQTATTTSSTRTPVASPGMVNRPDRIRREGGGAGADLFFRNVGGS